MEPSESSLPTAGATTLRTAALQHGGVRDPDNGEWVFYDVSAAASALELLGEAADLSAAEGREVRLAVNKAGKLAVKIARTKGDAVPPGWFLKKGYFQRELETAVESGEELPEFDDLLRRLVAAGGESAGWMIRGAGGTWYPVAMPELRPYLIAQRTQKEQIDPAIGDAIWRPWKLVNIPFAEEYPGGRQWNHNAAQLVYQPADDAGDHPHWSTILDHCGDSLDPELQKLQWAADAGIASGGDYLKAWIAAMVREPFEPLPYLFFFGPENSGKSIFHEAVALLVTKGVVQADRSLTNQNDFNGELANAVLCVVEEKDIATAKGAYAKIKEWVTAKTISIRRMRTDSYTQPNTTHWVQCANSRQFCPVFPGDTRITMSYVPPLKHEIPKPILLERLKAEAPRFMRTLADLKLPGSEGRLRIPIVATDQKRRAEQDAMTPLEKFLVEHVERVANQKSYLHLNDIREAFVSTLSEAERQTCETDKLRPILERLPEPYELGRDGKGTKIKGVKWRAESEFATAT